MKKIIVLMLAFGLMGCAYKNKKNIINDEPSKQESVNPKISWDEIDHQKVNEELLLQHIDIKLLENIADELQSLTNEITDKQVKNSSSALNGSWVYDIKNNLHYQKVIQMGQDAMKPLYWIIYKSPNEGLYEYICSLALEEISNFHFEDKNGLKWATSKEFLKQFNKKIED